MNQPQAANPVNGSSPVIIKNNLAALSEFKIKVVTTAQGATTNLLLMLGPVPTWLNTKFATNIPEQTEIKLSSSVSANNATGLIEYKAYLAQVGMYVTGIRIITTDTAVYGGSLYMGEMPPNGIASPQEINLAQYTTGLGGGIDKTLNIRDQQFSVTRNFFMYLSVVPASCTIDIALTIGAIGNTITASAM